MDSLFSLTTLFFVANALYLLSYLLASMLWLRVLAIAAAVTTLSAFGLAGGAEFESLAWQAAYLLANAANLGYLLYRMRIPRFSLFEQVVYREKFYDLEPHEVIPIFKRARRLSIDEEFTLLNDGQANETLYLIVSGHCRIDKGGQEVALLGNGDFIGELSFISDEPVNADVIALPGAEMMCWDKGDLAPLFESQGLYKAFFYSLFSVDIAQKLRAMTASAGG